MRSQGTFGPLMSHLPSNEATGAQIVTTETKSDNLHISYGFIVAKGDQ